MKITDAEIGKNFLGKFFVFTHDRLFVRRYWILNIGYWSKVIFAPFPLSPFPLSLYKRTNNKSLSTFFNLTANKIIRFLTIHRLYYPGDNFFASGGQFTDNGNFQIAINNESQRSWDGGGGHTKKMRPTPLFFNNFSLFNTKAVLFVHNHKTEFGKFDIFG